MTQFFRGMGYLLEGLALIRQPGLRRFVLVPLTINVGLFGGLLWWAVGWVNSAVQYLLGRLPDWLAWLSWLVWPVFVLLALLLVFYGFSALANFIAAPFNGLLAEAVETHLRGRTLESGWLDAVKDMPASLASELHKLGYFLLRAIPLGLLFLVPLANLAAPLLWLAFSAWMLAIQYADYPMANHRLRFAEQRRRLRRQPLLALGFGVAVLLLTLVPVANFLVMPAAVAGASAWWSKEQAPG